MGTLSGPIVETPTPAFVDVVPKTAKVSETEAGAFQLTGTTPIVATGTAVGTASLLATTLRSSTGLALPSLAGPTTSPKSGRSTTSSGSPDPLTETEDGASGGHHHGHDHRPAAELAGHPRAHDAAGDLLQALDVGDIVGQRLLQCLGHLGAHTVEH